MADTPIAGAVRRASLSKADSGRDPKNLPATTRGSVRLAVDPALAPTELLHHLAGWLDAAGYGDDHPWRLSISATLAGPASVPGNTGAIAPGALTALKAYLEDLAIEAGELRSLISVCSSELRPAIDGLEFQQARLAALLSFAEREADRQVKALEVGVFMALQLPVGSA